MLIQSRVNLMDLTPFKREISTFVTFCQLSPRDKSEILGINVIGNLLDVLDCAVERAAIREFDAGTTRSLAESRAMQTHEPAILSAIENAGTYPIKNVSYKFLELLIANSPVVQSDERILTVKSSHR